MKQWCVMFGDHQGLPAVCGGGEAAGEQGEQASLRAHGKFVAIRQGAP